jgi:hypothetical protein
MEHWSLQYHDRLEKKFWRAHCLGPAIVIPTGHRPSRHRILELSYRGPKTRNVDADLRRDDPHPFANNVNGYLVRESVADANPDRGLPTS